MSMSPHKGGKMRVAVANLDERFDDISQQIKSTQKAVANLGTDLTNNLVHHRIIANANYVTMDKIKKASLGAQPRRQPAAVTLHSQPLIMDNIEHRINNVTAVDYHSTKYDKVFVTKSAILWESNLAHTDSTVLSKCKVRG